MDTNQPWVPQAGAVPQQESPGHQAQPNGATHQAVPSSEPQEIVDENDPRLVSEPLDVNLDADAFAVPAPPPDGKYRAKLKLEGVKQEGTTEKKAFAASQTKKAPIVPFFTTNISCSIIDGTGRYDNITVYPQFGGGVNTNPRKDKSTQISTILARLTRPDGQPWVRPGMKLNPLEWITTFVKALATEPEVGIETAWEVSCQKCGEEEKAKGYPHGYPGRTLGMHNFPQEQDPAKRKLGLHHSPELRCTMNPSHGSSRARAVVVRFLHLKELQ